MLLARRERLDALIPEQSVECPWAPLVARLRCLRGIDTLTAVGLVAETGDIAAFSHPKQLASYLGLVPSEHSSGVKRRQGAITKAGSSHARRLISVMLIVDDADAAVAWYKDALGATELWNLGGVVGLETDGASFGDAWHQPSLHCVKDLSAYICNLPGCTEIAP